MKTSKQNIFMVFHGRYPSETAASLFAAKSSEAFARQGISVTLVVPRRLARVKEDSYAYYAIENNFKVVFLPTIDLFWMPYVRKIAFHISFISFSVALLVYLLFRAHRDDVIYSNESIPLLLVSYWFKQALFEVHNFPERHLGMYRTLFKNVRWILVTNKLKRQKLEHMFPEARHKYFYEPNAVEIKDFDLNITRHDARTILNLPQDTSLVVYTGHLYTWKGVDTLVLATQYLPDTVHVVCVGGTVADVNKFKQKYRDYKNVSFMGFRKHEEIPLWQKAGDVLVMPNTGKEEISKYYTSPMKLFEYMASQKPIVASNLPSIVEILNNRNAFLCDPDDPHMLARTIISVLDNQDLAFQKSAQAYVDVQLFSWDKRAQRILCMIQS